MSLKKIKVKSSNYSKNTKIYFRQMLKKLYFGSNFFCTLIVLTLSHSNFLRLCTSSKVDMTCSRMSYRKCFTANKNKSKTRFNAIK